METDLRLRAKTNLGDLLDRSKDPAKLALIDCLDWERPREYTHGQIDALSDACARGLLKRGLLKRGLRRGDAVAILSANRAEFLIAYFGIMRAGLVAVPVNHKFPRDTINFVMRDSNVKLVFCDAERRPSVAADLALIEFGSAFEALLDRGPFETAVPSEGEVAMVLYTSGSTGQPKGVPLSHAGHLWAVESRLRTVLPGEHRLIVAAPLFHMNALGTSKFVFAAHASMVLMPQFDARRYIEAVGRYRVTWLTSVPTMLAIMVREKDTLAKTDMSSVRTVRMGSAPTTQKLIDDLRHLFPNATVMNAYGTTEAGPVVFGPHPDGRPRPDMALGWPLPDVQVRLIDAQGRDADEGVLVHHTPATMTGYLNLPEKSREALTPEGWYISGDVFRRDANGTYYFIGRADDMFNCGGENIYPGEVEHMLEKHPDIAQSCVVPVPDEIKGEKPFAFIVRRPGASLTEEAIKQYALANAPAYQHPRQIEFMDALPLAGPNKIDRKLLKSMMQELWRERAKAGG
jgi:acyl-CoA synthetase (AMP-forming)/AMP-acid ligase II